MREIDDDQGRRLATGRWCPGGGRRRCCCPRRAWTCLRSRRWRSPARTGSGTYLPFSTWSLAKLADFLVAEGVVDEISHEGLRVLLRREGVSFQRLKTWKASKDPRYAAKKARIEQLYAIADRKTVPGTATRRSCSAWMSSGR